MNAGIVYHEAGTRDVRRLGGLASLMPSSALLGIVAAAAMAGLPPLNGFLSKEMMLEEAAHTGWHGIAWLVPVIAVAAATLSVAYSLRSEEHTSELQSLMRISYAVFCLKKKKSSTSHKQVNTQLTSC